MNVARTTLSHPHVRTAGLHAPRTASSESDTPTADEVRPSRAAGWIKAGAAGLVAAPCGAIPIIGAGVNLLGGLAAAENHDDATAIIGFGGAVLNVAASIAIMGGGMTPWLLAAPAVTSAIVWGLNVAPSNQSS